MLHHKNAILIAPNFATHCGVRLPSPAGMERSGIPVRVHGIVVCRAWPGCYMVMSGKIMTQLPGKVQTQPDGGEG